MVKQQDYFLQSEENGRDATLSLLLFKMVLGSTVRKKIKAMNIKNEETKELEFAYYCLYRKPKGYADKLECITEF